MLVLHVFPAIFFLMLGPATYFIVFVGFFCRNGSVDPSLAEKEL